MKNVHYGPGGGRRFTVLYATAIINRWATIDISKGNSKHRDTVTYPALDGALVEGPASACIVLSTLGEAESRTCN